MYDLGCDAVVPCTGSFTWLAPLLDGHRYVVRGLYLCGDGDAGTSFIPW